MPTQHANEDDEFDDDRSSPRSWEDPDASDMDDEEDDDGGYDTVPCPYCRKPISELAELCPFCKSYISLEDVSPRRHPWWVIAAAVACLLAILLFWVL